jgi:4-hydroxybenzoate polyprenyltransferase
MSKTRSFIALIRPKQWVKNVFVILPFLFIASEISFSDLITGIQMLAIFILAASSVYCFNDVYDAPKDRLENRKYRPIAMGSIRPLEAQIFSTILFLSSITLCFELSTQPLYCASIIGFYVFINFIYSKYGLKKHSSIGLMIVASGFPLRFLFGTIFLNLDISYWALIMLFYLSLFLLAGKRLSRANQIANQTQYASAQGEIKDSKLETEFWKNILLILGAASISSYLAFLADNKTQQHWGNSISMFSVVPYSIFILNYFEFVMRQESEGDSTENITNNAGFLILGIFWGIIMVVSRLNQSQ